MEKITTKEALLDALEGVRAIEINARDNYVEDIATFKNFKITDTIKKIKIDEDKHIKLIDEIIDILK